jgi:hypothetical protein
VEGCFVVFVKPLSVVGVDALKMDEALAPAVVVVVVAIVVVVAASVAFPILLANYETFPTTIANRRVFLSAQGDGRERQ